MKTRTLLFIALCSMVFFACESPAPSTETASADSVSTLVIDSASTVLVDTTAVDTTKK